MDSTLLSAIPLAGALALAWKAVTSTRGDDPPSATSVAWSAVFVAALLGAAAACLVGLYAGGVAELVGLALVGTCCGCASLLRERVAAALDVRGVPGALRVVLALVVATIAGGLALEMTYNAAWASVSPLGVRLELEVIGFAMVAAYLLSQRRGAPVALLVAALFSVGLAQYFVLAFKGTAIMPSDLLALSTAAAVGSGFTYVVGGSVALGLSAACVGVCAASLASARPLAAAPSRRVRGLSASLCAVAGALALVASAWVAGGGTSYYWTYGIGIDFFSPIETYREQGLIPGFVAAVQDMAIAVPEGYDPEEAERLLERHASGYDSSQDVSHALAQAQFEEVRPTVVAIMNESFSDLSVLGEMGVGYEGPRYFGSMDDSLVRGTLYTSVMGGGTCNSEFEFLSGESLAYVRPSKYPYTLYDLSGVSSLARQFSDLGYATCAIHPNLAGNWRRDEVYETFGFDRFLSIGDFEGAPTFHTGVSDRATYDRILELLAEDDAPQFVFDVTMQNHGGYAVGNIPASQLTDYRPEALDGSATSELNEYLSCMEASDDDLEYLVGRLRDLDRPVVLVFFGDHQPGISPALNDALNPDEDPESLEHALRIYQTEYVIWANYDVAGSEQVGERMDTSAGYLGTILMERIGAPLTRTQRAHLDLRAQLPALSILGYMGADGSWNARGTTDSPAWTAYDELNRIEYLEFGSTVQ